MGLLIDRDFKWNNCISRDHMRRLDLLDLLALYQPKNNAPLDAKEPLGQRASAEPHRGRYLKAWVWPCSAPVSGVVGAEFPVGA